MTSSFFVGTRGWHEVTKAWRLDHDLRGRCNSAATDRFERGRVFLDGSLSIPDQFGIQACRHLLGLQTLAQPRRLKARP